MILAAYALQGGRSTVAKLTRLARSNASDKSVFAPPTVTNRSQSPRLHSAESSLLSEARLPSVTVRAGPPSRRPPPVERPGRRTRERSIPLIGNGPVSLQTGGVACWRVMTPTYPAGRGAAAGHLTHIPPVVYRSATNGSLWERNTVWVPTLPVCACVCVCVCARVFFSVIPIIFTQ